MKKVDLFVMILLPVLAAIATAVFGLNLLVSNLLFFALPAAYISLRNPGIVKKSLIFSLLLSVPQSLFFDVLAVLDQSWVVPHSIFSFRFFGLATIEIYIMSFLWVFLAILFYEHFLEKSRREKVMEPRMKYLCLLCISLTLITLTAWFLNNIHVLAIPYFYFLFSILFMLVLALFLYFHPKLLQKFFLEGLYFFFALLLFEFAALYNGQWIFSSTHYVGFVELFGFRFPLEEFVFWMIFCVPTLLAIYEFFDDDRK